MPTALITGSAKGIGRATATALARQGYRLWIADRDAALGQGTADQLRVNGLDVRFVPLDVTDTVSIATAAAIVAGEEAALDVLVNNAGISGEETGTPGAMIAPSSLPPSLLHRIFEVNFFGAVAVTQAFLPLLRGSRSARIVNLSSVLGSFAATADPNSRYRAINALAYKASKAALNMATLTFAEELRETGIKVNSVSPGLVATDLSGPGGADRLSALPGFSSPEEAARVVVRFATLPDDGPTGQFHSFDEGQLAW